MTDNRQLLSQRVDLSLKIHQMADLSAKEEKHLTETKWLTIGTVIGGFAIDWSQMTVGRWTCFAMLIAFIAWEFWLLKVTAKKAKALRLEVSADIDRLVLGNNDGG